MLLFIVNFVTKVGIFLMLAYFYSLSELFFLKYTENKKQKIKSYGPTSFLPIGEGILLPIFTTLLFGIPIGFTRNVHNTYTIEVENYPARFFALGLNLVIHFALLLTYALFPYINYWSGGIFGVLIHVNLVFLVINVLPIFPSSSSYGLVFLVNHIMKKRKIKQLQFFKVVLAYKYFSIAPWFALLAIDHLKFLEKKVNYFLQNIFLFPKQFFMFFSGGFFILLLLMIQLRRVNMKRYYQKLNNAIYKLFKDAESYDQH